MRALASLFGTTILTAALFASCTTADNNGGPTGAAGTGTTGAAGTGTPGAAGTGTTGAAGTGTTGAAGTGTTGAAGTGTTGAAGTGVTGAAGTGVTGAAGTGVTGAAGTGVTGAAGTGVTGAAGTGGPFTIPTVTWPSAACKTMAADIVGKMTRAQKAAQMVMAPMDTVDAATAQAMGAGAVFAPGGYVPNGNSAAAGWAAKMDTYLNAVPASGVPFFIGADAVHGANVATGTVIFPHNAGLGGTRDPALVQEVGRISAMEVAALGVNWTFSPVVSVSWDDRWGRVYESFGEDPTLAQQMAAAATMGLQGAMGLGTGKPGIVGCSKHWAGDGQATAGTSTKGGIVDRGDIRIDEATMRKFGVAPYLDAIKAGLGSIMVSDARWNGQSLTASTRMTNDILKTELKFQGFVATDWNASDESPGSTIPTAVNSGVDMLMHPKNWTLAISTINSSAAIPEARLTDAATRIVQTKCEAGLFGKKRDTTLMAGVGSAEHREVGRRAVRASMVLLQNTGNVLPLAKTSKVFVTGSGANSLANQCGGWTITWQGDGSRTTGTTISQAVGRVAMPATSMAAADAIVVVLSEKPYAEFLGDSMSLNTLPDADKTLLMMAKAMGKKTVAIVLSGRPVLIADQLANAGAWIAGWLPGTEGTGVADVLFGDYKPTAKLSHSWPRTDADARINMGDAGYNPLFALGHGLTY